MSQSQFTRIFTATNTVIISDVITETTFETGGPTADVHSSSTAWMKEPGATADYLPFHAEVWWDLHSIIPQHMDIKLSRF